MRNLLGIENDPGELRFQEREYTRLNSETVHNVKGGFDEKHLRDIHRHIFQDVYEWAGTMRHDTIQLDGETIHVPDVAGILSKGSSNFLPAPYLARGLAHIAILANSPEARSTDLEVFSNAITEVLSDLNHAHPFREGNGRTQRAFIEQLAIRAGHEINFEGVTTERNVSASVDAHHGDQDALHRIIVESLDEDRVELRMAAVYDLDREGMPLDDLWVETAQSGDVISGTIIACRARYVSVADENNRFIIVPKTADFGDEKPGKTVNLQYIKD